MNNDVAAREACPDRRFHPFGGAMSLPQRDVAAQFQVHLHEHLLAGLARAQVMHAPHSLGLPGQCEDFRTHGITHFPIQQVVKGVRSNAPGGVEDVGGDSDAGPGIDCGIAGPGSQQGDDDAQVDCKVAEIMQGIGAHGC